MPAPDFPPPPPDKVPPAPFPSEAGRLEAIAAELHSLAARVKGGGLDAALAEVRAALPAGWVLSVTWYPNAGYPPVSAVAALPGGGTGNLLSQYADTDVEALRALAAALRERQP